MQVVENIAEITAQNHSNSSGKDSVKFKGKRSGRVGSARIGKNRALCLEYHSRPWVLPEDLEHSFSQYGPPGWRIPYI